MQTQDNAQRGRLTGGFEVKMIPQMASDERVAQAGIGRVLLDKVYEGDLAAVGKGEMLSAMTATKGSAGYVAIELVSGTVLGIGGTFLLLHQGIMDRGVPSLNISVIPDSGTGDLKGIRGTLGIEITGGKHFYTFDYEIQDEVKLP